MATRKKKSDSIVLDMPGTTGSAKIILPETKVVKGSHLTITYNNGYPEKLEWDDEALLRDVQKALTDHENPSILTVTSTKVKKTKK
jgi:hypothetical protein